MPELNKNIKDMPEALSIFINQIVYDKKRRGEYVYTYSLGEANFEIPRFKISDEDFANGYHYSNSLGQCALREKIADLYKYKYISSVDPQKEILISAGSKPIIFMILKVILNSGDQVLVHEPAWLSYTELIKLSGGIPVDIPYYEEVDKWEKYLTDKTKIIIVNNPNNPSGQIYTKDELTQLLDLAKKHDLYILADEAYSDFIKDENKFISFASLDKTKDNSIVVNSLSKNMGISGWRLGYTIANNDIIRHVLKLNEHLITCAPTILQDYIAEHFEQILEATLPQAIEIAKKREKVQTVLNNIGIDTLKGEGTFYFMLNVSTFPGTTEELVYELLLNHNIATVPGEAYGKSTKDFIRFGIGVESLENIENSLKVIKQYLDLKEYDKTSIWAQMKKWEII